MGEGEGHSGGEAFAVRSGSANPEEFVAYSSPWRIVLLLLIAVAFVSIGLWMIGAFGPSPETRRYSATATYVVGWFSILFFGFCGVVAAKRLVDTSEQLRIGSNGVRYVPWSDQTIPWSEIVDVTTWRFKGQRSIVLHLRDPVRFPGRGSLAILAGANRALTGGHISISLTGTNRNFDDAMSAIELFSPLPSSRERVG